MLFFDIPILVKNIVIKIALECPSFLFSGVSPRILKPQMRHSCLDIEEKISHITDSKRTSIELWKGLKGSNATRETRMEVVAWIATCKFDCRLEGGFVRDWIVGNYTNLPTSDPSDMDNLPHRIKMVLIFPI